MFELYPLIIEKALQFWLEWRRLVAEENHEVYVVEAAHETVPIANGYSIIKEADNLYRCLLTKDQQAWIQSLSDSSPLEDTKG